MPNSAGNSGDDEKLPPTAARDQAASRAGRFKKTRADHANEIAEDYVELIRQFIREHGEARTVDIARALGVSHVTVNKTISRLQNEGLVESAPYRAIFLTEKGQALAKWSEARHQLIVRLLRHIGVNDADAERDAEGIEHHLSAASLEAIQLYLEQSAD